MPALVVGQRVKVDVVGLGLGTSGAEHQTVLPPLHLFHLSQERSMSTLLVMKTLYALKKHMNLG